MSASRFPNGLSTVARKLGVRTDFVSKTRVEKIGFADGTAENNTSFVMPLGAVVEKVYLNVKTAEATGVTKTINIGTTTATGDPNGFVAAGSVAALGIVKGTLASAGQTLGALLFVDESGAGGLVPENDTASGVSGTETLTWTPGSNDWAEFDGDIIIEYKQKVALVG